MIIRTEVQKNPTEKYAWKRATLTERAKTNKTHHSNILFI